MNIVIMYIAVGLAVIAAIVFGVWLHGYIEDTDRHIETLYADADKSVESAENIAEEISALRKEQDALKEWLHRMPHDRPRYGLNAEEREAIASVIEAEAGGEDFTGRVLVAQCILNACEKDDIRPIQAIRAYQYATARPEPSELTRAAVRYVFDEGQAATEKPVMLFYAPARCESKWHESQEFLLSHGGHRFFKLRD